MAATNFPPQSLEKTEKKRVTKPAGSKRRVSFQSIRRVLNLIPAENCVVDRRWQIATVIAHRPAPPKYLRKLIDRDVTAAVDYLRTSRNSSDELPDDAADLHHAWTLRFQSDLLTRATVEARLLARQTIEETAAACHLPIAAVRWYASLFFDVQSWLRFPFVIIGDAIGPKYWEGLEENDVDIIVKSLAYFHGSSSRTCS